MSSSVVLASGSAYCAVDGLLTGFDAALKTAFFMDLTPLFILGGMAMCDS